ncbi:MAG TPA: dicarboxylate--CoA ligase PimA [Xanthobacteraceae bacterium]|nr:dicarboxylate--CoA ligase PimA [Xanthobacteraceae bacterium]
MTARGMRPDYPGEKYYPPDVRWDTPIPNGTLPGLLSGAVERYGDLPAIEFRDRPISYNELEAMVERTAAAHLRAGTGKGQSVALFLGNTPDHPVNFFGALKAGARVVHLSPLDGERALSHKLSDSGARVLVTSNLATLLPTALKFLDKGLIDRLIVCEDEDWGNAGNALMPLPDNPAIVTHRAYVEGAKIPAEWPAIAPLDTALLQYTGGTTGLPKGAMLSHSNLTSAVGIYEVFNAPTRAAKSQGRERVICVLPLFHIYALTVILLRCLKLGDLISMHQRFEVGAVLRDIEVKRATAFPGVPTMWIAIANDPSLESRDLSSLTSCGSGGAPLPVEVARIFERKTNLSLKSGWGMTETCSPGTSHPPEGPDKPGSIGLMLPSIEIDVVALDDPTRVLPQGETGELRIRGPNVTRGYWNIPDTEGVFVGDRFLTGDIGYMDADGYFYLVDRKKDMIISGGFNVYPQMIEQAIYEHPAVQEVLVIGVPDEYRGEAAKAFVTLRAGAAPFTIDELRSFLAGKLGRHELPADIAFVAELPRTPVGKLSRHQLREQVHASFPSTQQSTQQKKTIGVQ